jgi:hypothetical protein
MRKVLLAGVAALLMAMSAASVTPASGGHKEIGGVYLMVPNAIACRLYTDALEVYQKWGGNRIDEDYWWVRYSGDREKKRLEYKGQYGVNWWQDLKKLSDRDCIDADYLDGYHGRALLLATKIDMHAPGLPQGKIAVCVSTYRWLSQPGITDCGYWVVIDPQVLMRSFNLPEN